MNIAVVGLGKMGSAIAERAHKGGHTVFGFDVDEQSRRAARAIGIKVVDAIQELADKSDVFWLMVPVGDPVDQAINALQDLIQFQSIIIDGGNSKFTDSQRRARELAHYNLQFLDCGTSGGLKGREIGFSLMVGGDHTVYNSIVPLLKSIAAPNGYGYVGPSGAGHYVKMVHNGIEYALLQTYAEGFQLLKQGSFKSQDLNLEQITGIWQHGSVIRSWLLDLSHDVFKRDQRLQNIRGEISEGGTGQWTVEDARKHNVPVPLIEDALKVRALSRETGGNYATKIVALLREQFGGHEVKKVSE